MAAKDRRAAEALRVAKMYYQQDRSQSEISKELSISRPTVSRLLRYALDTGLVRIEIGDPGETAEQMADELLQRYNLRHVIVVPTRNIAPADRLDTVGHAAASYIESIVRDLSLIHI